MRIQSIHVKNFKSLVDFKLDLSKFNCLIGLNGSGKSTVLQFFDFLAQLVRGRMDEWFEERGWKPTDILCKLAPIKTFSFEIKLRDANKRSVVWNGIFNPAASHLRCTTELITASTTAEIAVDSRGISVATTPQLNHKFEPSHYEYQGSILSLLKDQNLPTPLLALKNFLRQFESLELLTPERLRGRPRKANGSLGYGGRNLPAYIHEIGVDNRRALAKKLKPAYPQLDHVYSKSLRAGWKQLQFREYFQGHFLTTEATHVNDGMLRLLAILAEIESEHEFLLFDEIENGINPELVEFVCDALVKAKQQVVVTTHSPLILNFLPDEVAREGVIYLYKTKEGHTKAVRFFDLPAMAKKLRAMGPGEAYIDTKLTDLADDIDAFERARSGSASAEEG